MSAPAAKAFWLPVITIQPTWSSSSKARAAWIKSYMAEQTSPLDISSFLMHVSVSLTSRASHLHEGGAKCVESLGAVQCDEASLAANLG